MDLYEVKIRAQQAASALHSLSWKDPDQRRVLVLLVGGAAMVVLLPIAAWVLLGSSLTTSQAEQAARLNSSPSTEIDRDRATLARVRDQLAVKLREDDRFRRVLLRPGASSEAPDAVATLQGTVSSRSAFDALVGLVDSLRLSEAVHVRVAIEPGAAAPSPGG